MSLLRSTLTLLAGGALAQLIPLALGPVITRLFTPEAFGVFTSFSTIAATVAVVACARYEFALPMAREAREADSLLALSLRILLGVLLLSLPLAWALHRWGHLPLPGLLPLAVVAAGLLQLLTMWSNRAQRFRALAISRVLQYGGTAVLQVLLGAALWWQARSPAGSALAWALVAAPIAAAMIASLVLLRPAPAAGWRGVLPLLPKDKPDLPLTNAAIQADELRRVASKYRDFPLLNTPHAFLGTLQDALAVALLIAWSGEAAAGFWGLALRYLKAPATLVGSAVSQALYPRLANARPADAQRAVRQIMLLLGAVALGLMTVLMIAGPWLFHLVFGEQWRDAGELARALAPYIAAHFVAAPLAVVTMAWKAQRWAFRWALVGQLAFVLALALGLRFGGLIAGAWAVSAAMVLYFGIYFWRLAFWPAIPEPEPQDPAEPGVKELVEEMP